MKMKFNIIITLLFCLNFLTFIISEETERSKTTNTLPERNKKMFPESSTLKDSNDGNIASLTQHPIICSDPNSALSGFQLWGKFGYKSNSIAYQWKCNKIRVTPGAKPTKGDYDGKFFEINKKNPVETLRNINFKCPKKDSIMKGFVLVKKGNKLTTKTTCIKAKISECRKYNLKFKNVKFGYVGKSDISQLGQFKLKLKHWQALQQVKGDYEKGDFRYRIKLCNIGDLPSKAYRAAEDANGGKKMKVLYSNPVVLRKGDDYCKNSCKVNMTEKKSKCLEYGVIGCSTCDTVLPKTDPKYQSSQNICNTYCNIYTKANSCKFYEFKVVVRKKKIKTSDLQAFNLADVSHKNIK